MVCVVRVVPACGSINDAANHPPPSIRPAQPRPSARSPARATLPQLNPTTHDFHFQHRRVPIINLVNRRIGRVAYARAAHRLSRVSLSSPARGAFTCGPALRADDHHLGPHKVPPHVWSAPKCPKCPGYDCNAALLWYLGCLACLACNSWVGNAACGPAQPAWSPGRRFQRHVYILPPPARPRPGHPLVSPVLAFTICVKVAFSE